MPIVPPARRNVPCRAIRAPSARKRSGVRPQNAPFWGQTPIAGGARRRTYHARGGRSPCGATPDQADGLTGPLSPALRRHCLRLAGNSTDAEDLVQEAFAALIRRGGPIAPDDAAPDARHLRPQRPRQPLAAGAPQVRSPTPTPRAAAMSRRPSPTGWNWPPSPRPSPGCPSGSGVHSPSPAVADLARDRQRVRTRRERRQPVAPSRPRRCARDDRRLRGPARIRIRSALDASLPRHAVRLGSPE